MLRAADMMDAGVRRVRGGDFRGLPPYSCRIRATGIPLEFGGRKFLAGGRTIADRLTDLADLQPEDRVLEIGCGCGRTAFALVDRLSDGRYVGLDIDAVQISACTSSPRLSRMNFGFVSADVQSDLYNPEGRQGADSYRLPFANGEFDLVFLTSVFTHLLPAECQNYAAEIMRVLRPAGRCAVTAFIDDGRAPDNAALRFNHQMGIARVVEPHAPRKAVAYPANTLDAWFGTGHDALVKGSWRGQPGPEFQDWLVYRKPVDQSSKSLI